MFTFSAGHLALQSQEPQRFISDDTRPRFKTPMLKTTTTSLHRSSHLGLKSELENFHRTASAELFTKAQHLEQHLDSLITANITGAGPVDNPLSFKSPVHSLPIQTLVNNGTPAPSQHIVDQIAARLFKDLLEPSLTIAESCLAQHTHNNKHTHTSPYARFLTRREKSEYESARRAHCIAKACALPALAYLASRTVAHQPPPLEPPLMHT
jgi:hypothetical protein